MTIQDVSEKLPYNLAAYKEAAKFELSDIAYDVVIDELPFILSANNQNPYRRETAQYRKDQNDNSPEPGEQSFSGWWLRSQTSWHNGSGIKFYEPGTDYQHVSHRFADSRGIDVWTIGEARLLNDVSHSYTGSSGIVGASANDGTHDVLISGDGAGKLKKITYNDDTTATVGPDPTIGYTLFVTGLAGGTQASHNSDYAFQSVTTDGSKYYAACTRAIHAGDNTADQVIYQLGTTAVTGTVIRYTKNSLFFGMGKSLYLLDPNNAAKTQHSSTANLPSGTSTTSHTSDGWAWTDIVGGQKVIYASGKNASRSEIWIIPFDDGTLGLSSTPTFKPYLPAASVAVELPFGEYVNSLFYYLGYLAVGTSKGIRICQVADNGALVLGPLLFETSYGVQDFVANDTYVWAATTVLNDAGTLTNGVLVRIDLSQQFDDGTFAYAYDLQYESDKDSECTGVHYGNKRLHMIINEPSETPAGEIQSQNLSTLRSSGWLKTGVIRYNTVEKKFFKYINVQCDTGTDDSITINTIDAAGSDNLLVSIGAELSGTDIEITTPSSSQEEMAFKFILNNVNASLTDVPVLKAYQLKSLPAIRRQRLIQFPLQCFDIEQDSFNTEFGYTGRALEVINKLEALEESGKFVSVIDYRTNESFQGVIEEVRFTNESSPDKRENGFGGYLLVTVRKM